MNATHGRSERKPPETPRVSSFKDSAAAVLSTLRTATRGVLAELDGISKPADLQRALKLDQTLSWQICRIAGPTDLLSSGSAVPSRTSIERFLKAAKTKGVKAAKAMEILEGYDAFEALIERHAGDRVTFNSMVSAASGVDEEWLTTDLQHRRNMFRGMSHSMGLKARCRLQTAIVTDSADGKTSDWALLNGQVDLQILRAFDAVRVYGLEFVGDQQSQASREPLGDCEEAGGHFISKFSSRLPCPLQVSEHRDGRQWNLEASLVRPDVGKLAMKTFMFGHLFRKYPYIEGMRAWNIIVARPVEVLINDMLVAPGSLKGMEPTAEVFWGLKRVGGPPTEVIPVEGKYSVERLGKGADALACPDVPQYPEMIRATAKKTGWDLDEYQAYRIRVEFPIYQTNVRMRWDPR
jgi:hypothetical protein